MRSMGLKSGSNRIFWYFTPLCLRENYQFQPFFAFSRAYTRTYNKKPPSLRNDNGSETKIISDDAKIQTLNQTTKQNITHFFSFAKFWASVPKNYLPDFYFFSFFAFENFIFFRKRSFAPYSLRSLLPPPPSVRFKRFCTFVDVSFNRLKPTRCL